MDSENPFRGEFEEALSEAMTALGLRLCHLGWKGGRRGTLTLTIDREGGVSLEDCEAASRAASAILDARQDALPSYVLEVESPGLDRPLWTLEDCVRFKGKRVTVKLGRATEGTTRLKGVLEEIVEDRLTVLDEDRQRRYTVPFGDVKLARLVPEW
jgi:ribosome maturation factor RimP